MLGTRNFAFARKNTKKLLASTLIIVLTSIVWSLIIPGFVSYTQGSFFSSSIESKVRGQAAAVFSKHKADLNAHDLVIEKISERVTKEVSLLTPLELKTLVETRSLVESHKKTLPDPVVVRGFYADEVNYVFVVRYIAMGFLLLTMHRRRSNLPKGNIGLMALVGYIAFMWTNLFRNFALNEYIPKSFEHGRTVYAYPHWDVDPLSFLLQEARIFAMFLLLAVVWHRSTAEMASTLGRIRSWVSTKAHCEYAALRAAYVSSQFDMWQARSILLAIAFLPWTYFFWASVAGFGDSRYAPTAIMIHVIWGVTWVSISRPLFYSWRGWSHFKALALVALRKRQSNSVSELRDLLRDTEPLSTVKIFWTTAAAGASFFLPAIQVLLR